MFGWISDLRDWIALLFGGRRKQTITGAGALISDSVSIRFAHGILTRSGQGEITSSTPIISGNGTVQERVGSIITDTPGRVLLNSASSSIFSIAIRYSVDKPGAIAIVSRKSSINGYAIRSSVDNSGTIRIMSGRSNIASIGKIVKKV
jgi:hypothetical protein